MYCSSQNFWNMCLETYQLELAHFLTAPGLIWQRAFQKLKSKIRSIHRSWYVINGTKMYHKWNMPCCLSICGI